MPKPWYHKGLRFECTQCGRCCTNRGEYSFVYLTRADVKAIAGYLGLDRAEFLKRHCVRHEGLVSLRMDSPACEFLRADRTCGIYPVRPKQCATWPFWRENLEPEAWEEVAEECPGIGKGRVYSRAEIERTVREDERWYAKR